MIESIIAFDHTTEIFFDLHRVPVLTAFFSWVTLLGDARFIIVLGLAMTLILFRHHRSAYVGGFAIAILGSVWFSYVLKAIVARGRPLPSFAALDAPGYSFPSMHAACAVALYGFLAYMIYKLLHPPHHRAPTIVSIMIIVALIGFSRLYLGVHYLSDVVVGFLIGGFFLWLGMATTMYLERQTRNALWRRWAKRF
ncbi:MAG TPA: phosphatase PAP2 family protein [Candidatus Paceibacterota bacterium]|nr:phosphatase PAP2 family protein [Candidatus Paceibacterota bacterium]